MEAESVTPSPVTFGRTEAAGASASKAASATAATNHRDWRLDKFAGTLGCRGKKHAAIARAVKTNVTVSTVLRPMSSQLSSGKAIDVSTAKPSAGAHSQEIGGG